MKNSFFLETFKQVALLPVFRGDLSMLTSLGMGDKRPPSIFKIALKNCLPNNQAKISIAI